MKDITVVFDLDGTMIDTAPDLIAATNQTLHQFGMASVEERVIEPAVSIGAKAMISTAMAALGRAPSEDEVERMTDVFIGHYRENIAVRSRPFPGLESALRGLRDEGARLAVCTNKREALSKKLLAELQLDMYFTAIAGGDTFATRKPDPGHLLGAIAMAEGHPGRAVMIGDSLADAGAARGAKVPFVAVSFGYGEKPVDVLQPDAVIDGFDELLPALARLINRG